MILPGTAVAAPPRPPTVTVAFLLQLGLAGLLLLLVAVVATEAVHYDGLIDRALRLAGSGAAEDAAFERSANVAGAVLAGFPALLLAVWFGSTAIGVRRGSNVGRVLTLVGLGAPLVLGILACFAGVLGILMFGVLLAGASEEFTGEEYAGAEDFAGEDPGAGGGSAFYDELIRLDSGGWSMVLTSVGEIAVMTAFLVAVAVGVLLITPTSNRYFRPRPPAPWPTYPPSPPYPPYPPYWYGPPR